DEPSHGRHWWNTGRTGSPGNGDELVALTPALEFEVVQLVALDSVTPVSAITEPARSAHTKNAPLFRWNDTPICAPLYVPSGPRPFSCISAERVLRSTG